MQNKVRIVIDSSADVPAALRAHFGIVPLTLSFGQEEFIDGVTIDHQRFYERLVESDVLPTTSQASPEAFAQVFRQARADGCDVVALTISSKLSGTCQSANIAAQEDPEHIFVVDTLTAALGTGILAQLALRLTESGLSAAQIADRLMQDRHRVHLVAMLDTLEYLARGGRISKTAALAGGLLSLKPVIGIRDGEIVALGKARGSRQGNNLLVKEIQAAGGVDFSMPLLLGYTGMDDSLLRKYVQDSSALWQGNVEELPCTIVGSVIGTHAGPGAVAVAFFAKE